MKKQLLSIVTAGILLLLPTALIAQATDLGTTASFVLFTTTGAVSNTGLSQVTGNVGTNTTGGAITGFGNINGTEYIGNSTTLTAAGDLTLLYTQLNVAPFTNNHAPLLGNGETLNAGVYAIAGVTTLNNVLTLDGQNNPNAKFIFQISAPFSTNASSKVMLINGALACNVFWKVEGAVNLGTLSTMRGTVVAHTGLIDMGAGVTLEGRALSTTGAITLDGTLAYLPTGCGSPVLNGPAAPVLGATACYALFTGNDAMTNAGSSFVTGDIGTNVGLTTGFNPLQVNGMIHDVPDGSTIACAAALGVVYNYLNTLPNDIELKFPAQLGNNLVLTPHTYIMNAAAALTGNLTLNAEGNTNAVFVIKIQGALTTSTFAHVILLNGTQAKNVFWKVNGAVSISDYSIFKGTIICKDGAVNLNTGVNLEGRALTTDGAFSTAAVTVVIPPNTCNAVVPVNWLSFTAEKKTNSSAILKWSTASEINNHHFVIQRSGDGVNFATLASVAAGNNNTTAQSYNYTDGKALDGNNFYRLQQVDNDGNFKYSAVVLLKMSTASWSVYPNPASTSTSVFVRSNLSNASFTLLDNNGKIVYQRFRISVIAGEHINIPVTNIARGIYMLNIKTSELNKTEKVIIQ
jgi:hypothetical protein